VLGGQAIAAERTPTKEGTLGLYLLVGGAPCALVSRHVVGENDHGSLSGQHVIMPGQTTYEAICNQQKENLAACITKDDKEACQKLGNHLGQLEELASRRIGHVLISPPCVPTTRPGYSSPWLPDYALVALDKGRLYDSLSNTDGLSNTVQVHVNFRQLRLMSKYRPNQKQPTQPLRLKDTFTPGGGQVVGKHGRSTDLT